MPNWCENHLRVSGTPKDLAIFIDKAKVKGSAFAFEPFLPMPKELDTGPCDSKVKPDLIKLTGYSNWYDRNCAVLGTKWDISEAEMSFTSKTIVSYDFNSAWAPPCQGLVAVSKQHPKLKFTLVYDEPGMDFAGTFVCKGGEVLSDEQTKSQLLKEMSDD